MAVPVKATVFYLGETWLISGITRDSSGAVLPLTGGASVRFRLTTASAIVVDWVTPTNGSITDPAGGAYEFEVTDAQQQAAAIALGHYNYEVKAFLGDGTSTVQNVGVINVVASLFKTFPPAH